MNDYDRPLLRNASKLNSWNVNYQCDRSFANSRGPAALSPLFCYDITLADNVLQWLVPCYTFALRRRGSAADNELKMSTSDACRLNEFLLSIACLITDPLFVCTMTRINDQRNNSKYNPVKVITKYILYKYQGDVSGISNEIFFALIVNRKLV